MFRHIGRPALRILLAVIVGVVLVFAIQITVTKLWITAGIQWSSTNLPHTPAQQTAALSTLFLAILVSTIGAAWIAGDKALIALIILVAIGAGVDGYAMFVLIGDDLPLWFRITFVCQIPLATIFGWIVVRSFHSKTASGEPVLK